MNYIRILTPNVIALATAVQAFAVDGLDIHIQSTNIVISWPSAGYESYLIQSRPTLGASTPWGILTNNYPANGNPRTTFTVYGAVYTSAGGGSGSSSSPPPSPMSAASAAPIEPLAARADGAGSIVPLALYTPDTDLSDFLIYDPTVSGWVKGSDYTRPAPLVARLDSPLPQEGQEARMIQEETPRRAQCSTECFWSQIFGTTTPHIPSPTARSSCLFIWVWMPGW